MGRVFACSDLHSREDLFKQIKDFLKPDDIVYYLGDAGDRECGKGSGWNLIKTIYNDPQFIYLKGNHEEMLCDAMTDDSFLNLYYMNGGEKTYKAWRAECGEDLRWCFKLANLPTEKVYINKNGKRIILCHAGYTPYYGITENQKHITWNREHFMDEWEPEYEDTYLVHGHTSLPYFDEYLWGYRLPQDPEPCWYCADALGIKRKVNIDMGACFTGITTLLDLDTFQHHNFYVK